LNLAHIQHGARIADIAHDRQPAQSGDNFPQEFKPQFDRITNQLANINKALGSIYMMLVWAVLLQAGILGKLWGFPERLWVVSQSG